MKAILVLVVVLCAVSAQYAAGPAMMARGFSNPSMAQGGPSMYGVAADDASLLPTTSQPTLQDLQNWQAQMQQLGNQRVIVPEMPVTAMSTNTGFSAMSTNNGFSAAAGTAAPAQFQPDVGQGAVPTHMTSLRAVGACPDIDESSTLWSNSDSSFSISFKPRSLADGSSIVNLQNVKAQYMLNQANTQLTPMTLKLAGHYLISGIKMMPGDIIHYSFLFDTPEGVSCESDQYSWQMPRSIATMPAASSSSSAPPAAILQPTLAQQAQMLMNQQQLQSLQQQAQPAFGQQGFNNPALQQQPFTPGFTGAGFGSTGVAGARQ